MKFSQLIIEIFFFKSYAENEARKLVTPVCFLFFKKALYQVKASDLQVNFTISQQLSNQDTITKICLKVYTIVIDPKICSVFIFQIRVWEQFLQHILCMIFQKKKCSSCYNLLPDQISLPGCLYFLRYWAICVLQLVVNHVVTSKISKLT